MRLAGKVALVTGSAAGIGRATAVAFAKEGAAVVVNYSKSQAEAEGTMRAIADVGGKAILVQANVANESEVLDMVEETMEAFGRIDILVNNAGITRFVAMKDLDALNDEAWDADLRGKRQGQLLLCSCGRADHEESGGWVDREHVFHRRFHRYRQLDSLCGFQGRSHFAHEIARASSWTGNPRQCGRSRFRCYALERRPRGGTRRRHCGDPTRTAHYTGRHRWRLCVVRDRRQVRHWKRLLSWMAAN